MTNELTTLAVDSLTTTNAKGVVKSFERSVAFATKDARMGLVASVYKKQAESGNFARIINDAKESGLVNKANKAVVDRLYAEKSPTRNPGKAAALDILKLIRLLRVEKLTGEKKFFSEIVDSCVAMLEPVSQ